MGYTALYRKFRPLTFSEMVGQEHITRTLRNQIISNRVGHAYLFNGGRGTGKTSSAKILARAINCLNPKDGEPCNECEICKGLLNGRNDININENGINQAIQAQHFLKDIHFLNITRSLLNMRVRAKVHSALTSRLEITVKAMETGE